jgi:aminopeptidase N
MYYGGVWKALAGWEKTFRKQDFRNPRYTKIFMYAKYLINSHNVHDYLIYSDEWGTQNSFANNVNASLNKGLQRNYIFKKLSGNLTLIARTSFVRSDYNYSYLQCNMINAITWKKFDIRTRLFGQYGFGNIPLESALYAAGANTEEMLENKYTRSSGFFPSNWTGNGSMNHFHHGGGLNIRGYDYRINYHYLFIDGGFGNTDYPISGNSGAAFNFEIDFDRMVKIIPKKTFLKNLKVDTYAFSDIAIMEFKRVYHNTLIVAPLIDAGIGTTLTIRFTPYDIKPLTLRFDMPLFVNSNATTERNFSYRYRVGVNRAF